MITCKHFDAFPFIFSRKAGRPLPGKLGKVPKLDSPFFLQRCDGEPQLLSTESSTRGTLATSKNIVCEYLFRTVLMADLGFLCSVAFWASAMGRISCSVYPAKTEIRFKRTSINKNRYF